MRTRNFIFFSLYVLVLIMMTTFSAFSFPFLLGEKGGQIAFAEDPPPCSGGDENPACETKPEPPPCDDDNPDYSNPNCMSKTTDQLDGGFKFPGNTFKDYGNGIITAGGGIILGIAVLKIIFGGVMYATAAGNPQRITEAKSHITYALIGIALLVGMNIVLAIIGAETYN